MVKTDMAQVTPHTLKPGFAVSGKVQKLYENGLEISFLSGMTGTVFADHLSKSNATKYKLGEKVQALVISQDIASKATALSLLPNLLKMQPTETNSSVGQVYRDVKVEKKVFGNSYLLRLPGSPPVYGLLHKSNIPKPDELLEEDDEHAEEETKDLSSDDAKKRAK
jgi:ribosomal protein S1